MTTHFKYICVTLLTLIAMSGCDSETLQATYSDYRDLPEEGWSYADTLRFECGVSPKAEGVMSVALRHSTEFPYRNIWVETTILADSLHPQPRRDTLCIELADAYGRWLGTGQGAYRQVEADVARKVSVDSGRVIAVRHLMRLDTLPDICQLGIFIIPENNHPSSTPSPQTSQRK